MLRRRSASPSPAGLLDQIRDAQAEHAAAVQAANQRLVETHDSVYTTARNRQAVISEQIKLLNAEHGGLEKVVTVKSDVALI